MNNTKEQDLLDTLDILGDTIDALAAARLMLDDLVNDTLNPKLYEAAGLLPPLNLEAAQTRCTIGDNYLTAAALNLETITDTIKQALSDTRAANQSKEGVEHE